MFVAAYRHCESSEARQEERSASCYCARGGLNPAPYLVPLSMTAGERLVDPDGVRTGELLGPQHDWCAPALEPQSAPALHYHD